MKKYTIQTWSWSHGREGFSVALYESSYVGKILSDFIEASDMDWWGKYKNIPFCWINPWGWTYKVGTENHNLGSFWISFGQKILSIGYNLERSKLVKQFKVSDEEVKNSFPEIWEWASYWNEDE